MKIDSRGYRELTLDNGLFVALQNTPTQTISGRLRIFHGAIHEKKGEEGLAHFVEHALMTGGSKKYTPGDTLAVRSILGNLNAFTSPSETSFPVDMLAEDIELYLDFVSDTVSGPRFDEKKIEEERQRVLREMADAKSQPGFRDFKMFRDALFSENSPHNYFILGKEEVIISASVEDLQKFHERGYHASNMDLILAGGLPGDIEDLIAEKFGQITAGSNMKFVFPRNQLLEKNVFLHTSAPELCNQDNPQGSSAYLVLAFPSATSQDEDHYPVNMLVRFLGANSNSLLFRELSQKRGLAYDISAGYDFSDNKGFISIDGKIDASRRELALEAVFEVMKTLQNDLVSEQSLLLLKRWCKYQVAKTYELNNGHVELIQAKIDRGITPQQYFEGLDAVTPQRIRDAANKYLPSNREEGKYVLLLRDPLKR